MASAPRRKPGMKKTLGQRTGVLPTLPKQRNDLHDLGLLADAQSIAASKKLKPVAQITERMFDIH